MPTAMRYGMVMNGKLLAWAVDSRAAWKRAISAASALRAGVAPRSAASTSIESLDGQVTISAREASAPSYGLPSME